MQVDRHQFLLCASAIAAGCGGGEQPPAAPQSVVVAQPEPETDAQGPWAPVDSEPVDPAASADPQPPPPTYEGGPPPTYEGGQPPSYGSSSWAQCRAAKVPAPNPSTCRKDDVGHPGNCRTHDLCSDLVFICEKCERYQQHFKPGVAERAVACVRAQTPRQRLDGCQTYRCGDQALRSACIDTTAQAACSTIAPTCKTSMAECVQMLSGMNAAGRAAVSACAAKGCRFGLWSCIESM